MEDARVARLFLSAIIQREIIDIQFLPQELSGVKSQDSIKTSLNLSIYRLDFSAKVKDTAGNEELIIIEVQKTRMYGDIMRFRRYLGKQYMNEHHHAIIKDHTGKEYQIGIPIFSIYFFGTSLEGYGDHPIVQIKIEAKDHVTGEKIKNTDVWIKSLYHEGTIINIPALKGHRRGELELILSVFDQENRTKDMHILNVKEQDFPAKFQPIIRRLKQAVEVKEVRDVMEIEDDFVKEINEYENRVNKQTHLLEEAQRQKEIALRNQEIALCNQEEERRQKEEAILLLLQNGISAERIAEQLNLPLAYVESLNKR